MPITTCGWGSQVTPTELARVAVPSATPTYQPIAHHALYDMVEQTLTNRGHEVTEARHFVDNAKGTYLGELDLKYAPYEGQDISLSAGVINSHNKSWSCRFLIGANVFICSNREWNADRALARMHTARIMDDLPQQIIRAVDSIPALASEQLADIESLKEVDFSSPTQIHDLVIRSMDEGVIPSTFIPKVLEEIRNPSFSEFAEPSGWAIFNSYTHTLKGTNPMSLPARCRNLRTLIHEYA